MRTERTTRGLTRRMFVRGCTAALGLAAAACGSAPSDADAPPLTERQRQILERKDEAVAAAAKPSKPRIPTDPLRVYYLESVFGPTRGDFESMVHRASERVEGAPKLEAQRLHISAEASLSDTIDSFANAKGADILLFPAEFFSELSAAEQLTPLDKVSELATLLDDGTYWPNLIGTGQVRGRQLAVPLVLGPWLLLFNRAKLDEMGVEPPTDRPWDLKVFRENASRLTRPGQGDDPASLGFLQVISSSLDFVPVPPSWVWMASAGAEMPAIDGGESALSKDAAVKGLELMQSLVQRDGSFYNLGTNFSARRVFDLFGAGKVAMMSIPVNVGWFLTRWRTANSSGYELASLPGDERHFTPTEVHVMSAVSALTKELEAAISGLFQIAASQGGTMFPSALREDVKLMKAAGTVISDDDVSAIQVSLGSVAPIMFSGPEKQLLADKLDRAVLLDRVPPEEAVAKATEALEEARAIARA